MLFFENLEGRDFMSATVVFDGETLNVKGSPRNDAIVVTVYDGHNGGETRTDVHIDGRLIFNHAGYLQQIVVDGGLGKDTITVNYSGSGYKPAITVFGGAGNDTIVANMFGLQNRQDLLVIDGGDGNDKISVTAAGTQHHTRWNTIAVFGGAGKDTITISSDIAVNAFGGDGNDTFVVKGTPIRIQHLLDGGAGNDQYQTVGSDIIVIADNSGNDRFTLEGGDNHLYISGGTKTIRASRAYLNVMVHTKLTLKVADVGSSITFMESLQTKGWKISGPVYLNPISVVGVGEKG